MVSVPSGRDAWSKLECWVSGGSFSVICGTSLLCPRASVELDESRTVVKDREIAVGLGWAVADGMVLPMSSFDKMWGGCWAVGLSIVANCASSRGSPCLLGVAVLEFSFLNIVSNCTSSGVLVCGSSVMGGGGKEVVEGCRFWWEVPVSDVVVLIVVAVVEDLLEQVEGGVDFGG